MEQELSESNASNQRSERVKAEQNERLASLQMMHDNLDQERRGLLERLSAEEERNEASRAQLAAENKALAEHLARLEQERALYRQAMYSAEQRLNTRSRGFFNRVSWAILNGFSSWRGFFHIPAALWKSVYQSIAH